jgi:hypothetical protein
VSIIAIISIAILEGMAIWKGINGAYLTIVVAAIAGIAGYVTPARKGGR